MNAPLLLHAMIPDSARWKKVEKPMPINGKYVSIHAILASVNRQKENIAGSEVEVVKGYTVHVETITFLGSATSKSQLSPAPSMDAQELGK